MTEKLACSWFALIYGLPSLYIYPTFGLPYAFLWKKWKVMKITIDGLPYYRNALPFMVCPHWWFTLHVVYPTHFCGQNWRLWKLQLMLHQLWFARTDGLPYMWYTLLKFWLLWLLHFYVSFLEVYSLFIYCWKWIFNSWQIKLLIKSHLHFELILVLGLILQGFTNFKMAPNPRFLAMETFCNGWFTLRTGLDWGTFSRLCRIWWSCLFWSG